MAAAHLLLIDGAEYALDGDLSPDRSSDLPSDLPSHYERRTYSHENRRKSILCVQLTTGRCHMNKSGCPSVWPGTFALAHSSTSDRAWRRNERKERDPNPTSWRDQVMSPQGQGGESQQLRCRS